MLATLHENGVERPIEIVAPGNAGDLHRTDRVNHSCRPDGDARPAERTAEMDDVLRELADSDCLRHLWNPPGHDELRQGKEITALAGGGLDLLDPGGGLGF